MPEPSSLTNIIIPDIYWAGTLMLDISLGIRRGKSGYQMFFKQIEGEPLIYETKVAPWDIRRIDSKIAVILTKHYSSLSTYSQELLKSRFNDLLGIIQEQIPRNPQLAFLLTAEDGRQIIDRVVSVTIYSSDDGAGRGDVFYEIEVSEPSNDSSTKRISFTHDEMSSDFSTAFRKKWSLKFTKEFPVFNQEDWISLRESLMDIAVVKEVDETGEMEGYIEGLIGHLFSLPIVDDPDIWVKNAQRRLLYEKADDYSTISVTTSIIQEFLKKNDLTSRVPLSILSKECQKRGFKLGKVIQKWLNDDETDLRKVKRVWVFDADAIGFTPEMLVKTSTQSHHVPGNSSDEIAPGTDKISPISEIQASGGL